MNEKVRHSKLIAITIVTILLIVLFSLLIFFILAREPVAATYNGGMISENDVTGKIEGIKERVAGDDEKAWQDFLSQEGFDPASFREYIINEAIRRNVVAQHAGDVGADLGSIDTEEHMKNLRAQFGSEEEYKEYFTRKHTTEQRYRDEYTAQEKANSAYWAMYYNAQPADDEIEQQALDYIKTYGGSKKTYKIEIISPDESHDAEALAQAAAIREQIASDSISFENAALQYSDDDETKNQGGYAGWPMLDLGSRAYVDACSSVPVGQMSEALPAPMGAWIIKVVDELPTSDTYAGFDTLPDDIKEEIRKKAAGAKAMAEYDRWVDDLMSTSNVNITEMPKGLSYDVTT